MDRPTRPSGMSQGTQGGQGRKAAGTSVPAKPRSEGSKPRSDEAKPRSDGARPRPEGARPRPEGAKSRPEGAKPRPQTAAPQARPKPKAAPKPKRPPRLTAAEALRRRRAAAQAKAGRQARAERRWQAPLGSPSRRLTVGLVVIAVLASLLGARALQVQGLDPGSNAADALSETIRRPIIPATRGTVTDRYGATLVTSEPAVTIVADPSIIATNGVNPDHVDLMSELKAQAGPGLISGVLYRHLGGDFDSYYKTLTTTHGADGDTLRYAVVARSVRNYEDVLVNQELARLGYIGLDEESAPVRLHAQGTLAANVLGYMVYDEQLDGEGRYPWSGGGGLELALDANLAGVDGREEYEASSHGRIPTGSTVLEAPQNGVSYELTLDSGLQYMADTRLKAAVQEHAARWGAMVVMNAKTGEVLALSNYPTFDPNDIAHAAEENLRNRAVTEAYEPGSVQKVLTMAALLDSGLAATDTKVVVPGCITSAGRPLCDDDAYHATLNLTALGVIARSSNVGMALLTRQMDKGLLSGYLSSFGLGQKTGLGWPGESTGDLPGADMTNQTQDQIAFGQGLSVTAVQEAAAVAAVVNGGTYHSPTLIRQAWSADGQPYQVPGQEVRQVISEQASHDLVSMMEAAIVTAGKGVDGYRVAGKTGTADRYNADCACYRGTVGTFVGVAPAEDPEILVYVALDDPQVGQYGSQVAQPAATDILKVALPLYGVKPSTTAAPEFVTNW